MCRRCLCALLAVVAILVIFMRPYGAAAQQPTPRAYLPIVLGGARPPAGPTSDQLIDRALARGEIDAETALTYKVFAVFGDPRLPAAYHGDDSQLVDSHILGEVQARYAGLAAATQATLNPFLIPPAYAGSWEEPLPAAPGRGPLAPHDTPPPCENLDFDKWAYVDGAHVRVWWKKNRPVDADTAKHFIAELDGTVWPALTGLMKREPLSDAEQSCSGGSGKLDVYLDRTVMRSYAASHNTPGCKHTPSYIVLSPGASNSILAHEFMHAIQWGYTPKASCVHPGEYTWLMEATATWAEDFVYPVDNAEHFTAKWFFPAAAAPSLELKDDQHEYGAYLFFFFLVRSEGNAGLVKTIWDNTEGSDSLKAIDAAIPGGFEAVWAKFARYNVNVAPFDYYQKWDGQGVQPKAFDGVKNVAGAGKWPMSADVPHLGLVYQDFHFTGENARLVTFFNGLTSKLSQGPLNDSVGMTPINDGSQKFVFDQVPPDQIKAAKVQALFKIEGDPQWQLEDWTGKNYVSFCRDAKAERLEELVIVMSNSEYQDRSYRVRPLGEAPTLMVSDVGCWRYKGTASFEMSGAGDNGDPMKDRQWVDDVVFERMDAHPDIPYPFQTLQVQGGHWHRTYSATGECTAYGSEDKMLGGTGLDFDKSLWTITGATNGPSIGRYLGYATADQNITVEVNCPDGSGTITSMSLPWFEPSIIEPLAGHNFTVAAGGAMNETVRLAGGNGTVEHKWTLDPQREP